MAPEVLQVLLGRVPSMVQNVILQNHYIRHPVLGRVIPAPSPTTINTVEGVLICDITQREQQILDYFEEVDYVRKAEARHGVCGPICHCGGNWRRVDDHG